MKTTERLLVSASLFGTVLSVVTFILIIYIVTNPAQLIPELSGRINDLIIFSTIVLCEVVVVIMIRGYRRTQLFLQGMRESLLVAAVISIIAFYSVHWILAVIIISIEFLFSSEIRVTANYLLIVMLITLSLGFSMQEKKRKISVLTTLLVHAMMSNLIKKFLEKEVSDLVLESVKQ